MNSSKRTNKFTIGNLLFEIYFLYILWGICVEWINYLFTVVRINIFPFGIAEIFAIFLIIGFLIINRKHYVNEPMPMSCGLCIGIGLILIYGFLVSVYPDRGYDTYNYHIIAQSPEFRNYFEGRYFGLGNFQVWGFRLGDRLFYYFRCLLGFRMGTILNTLVLVIVYAQICQMLDTITGHCKKNFAIRLCSNKFVWAIAILFYTQTLLMFGSYYVDVLALPIGMEILRKLISDTEKETNSREIAYFALLNGIWLGFKLTNVIYVIPCVLLFLSKKINKFKIRDWFIAIFMGLFPFAVYLIYNFTCTRNLIFPYYNAIFKSPYYPLISFKDQRWGGTTLFEKLFWTLYAAFKPDYRQCEISDSAPPIVLMIGIAAVVFIVVNALVSRIRYRQKAADQTPVLLTGVTVISSFLWAFTTGYARYFIFGRILWGFLAYFFIVKLLDKFRIWGKLIACTISVMALICSVYNVKSAAWDGRNWSWTAWRKDTFKEELKVAFKDRTFAADYIADIDLFILTDPLKQGIAELLGREISIINTTYANFAETEYYSALNMQLSVAEKIADIHDRTLDDIAEYVDSLNNVGFRITGFEQMDTYLGSYEIVSVQAIMDGENTCWVSDGNAYVLPVEDNDGDKTLSFIAGRYYNWQGIDTVTLKICAFDGSNMRELATVCVDNESIDNFIIPLVLKENESQLVISTCESNGEQISAEQLNKVFIINATIK